MSNYEQCDAMTIPVFCARHGISRSTYYNIPQHERPREMRIGKRVLITKEAAARWREEIERKGALEVGHAGD